MKLGKRLFEPVDIFPVVLFRIWFGSLMAWESSRYLAYHWVKRYYIQPKFFFSYYGFEWLHPLPPPWMIAHFYALFVLAACIALGFFYRLAAILFFCGFAYIFLLDQTQYLNHFYLICLLSLLLIFVPANRLLSVDVRMRPKLRRDSVPAWTLWLLRLQVGIPYFFAGLAKMNGDWLRGEPLRDWLAQMAWVPVAGGLLTHNWVVLLAAWSSMLLDLLVFPLLLWPRTRPWALTVAILFHLANSQLFSIGVFPWMMIVSTTVLFLPAQKLRKFFQVPATAWPAAPPEPPAHWRLTAALLAVYLTLQFLLPLRHWLYPGDVSWTEEGHLFAWHMKLRDKEATVEFTAFDPATGQAWKVNALDYLTPRQENKMASRPDMILQFCHFLAEKFRAEGKSGVEIRVTAMAALNGRKPQYLIDPKVNLSAQPRTWKRSAWIVPLSEALPARGAAARAAPDM